MFYIKFLKCCQTALYYPWRMTQKNTFYSLARMFHKTFQNSDVHFKGEIKFYASRIFSVGFILILFPENFLELPRLIAIISLQKLWKNHNQRTLPQDSAKTSQPSSLVGESDLSVQLRSKALSSRLKRLTPRCSILSLLVSRAHRPCRFASYVRAKSLSQYMEYFMYSLLFFLSFLFLVEMNQLI